MVRRPASSPSRKRSVPTSAVADQPRGAAGDRGAERADVLPLLHRARHAELAEQRVHVVEPAGAIRGDAREVLAVQRERGGERGRRDQCPAPRPAPGPAARGAGSRPGNCPETIFSKRCAPGAGSSSSRSSAASYGVSTRGHPVEVPRFEIPDARRPQVRGQVGPGAQDQPHVGRRRGRVAPPRLVALQHQRGHRVVGHRGDPDPLETRAPERGGEQRGHVLALEALQRPALGGSQRHRPIDALEPGRVRVDERERRDRDALRLGHAPDRPRDQVEDRLRRAALVRLGEGERFLRHDARRPGAVELDQTRPGLGAPPVHHHHPAPLATGGLPRKCS